MFINNNIILALILSLLGLFNLELFGQEKKVETIIVSDRRVYYKPSTEIF